MAFSRTFSVGIVGSGVCSSGEVKFSVFAKIISWLEWAVAKKQTVVLAENCNFRGQRRRRFPAKIKSSVLCYQRQAEPVSITTDLIP